MPYCTSDLVFLVTFACEAPEQQTSLVSYVVCVPLQSGQGLSQADHQKRAKESYARLTKDIKPLLDSKHYPKVSRELRVQLGTLRLIPQPIFCMHNAKYMRFAESRSWACATASAAKLMGRRQCYPLQHPDMCLLSIN